MSGSAVLPDARARRGADRREGLEPLGELPRAAAPAQRAALPGARRTRASPRRLGALLPTEEPFLYTMSAVATDGTALSVLEAALAGRARSRPRGRHHARRACDAPRRSSRHGSSSTTTASRTSRIRSATSRRLAPATSSHDLPPRVDAVTLGEVATGAGVLPAPLEPHRRLVRSGGWRRP